MSSIVDKSGSVSALPCEPPHEGSSFVAVCGRLGDRLLVEHPTLGMVEAMTTLSLDARALAAAIALRQRAVAVFCDGTLVVTGLLQELPPASEPTARTSEPFVINAPGGLVLRCGQSSIRITPDGRVLIRGKRIVSRAELVNQVVGGSVRLN